MIRPSLRAAAAVLAAFTTAAAGIAALAEPEPIPFPQINGLEHYRTVERGATMERALTTRAAIDAVKAGQRISVGTQVVLEIYQSGELDKTFVMQKGEGLPDTGDWQFISFLPDRSISTVDQPERCASCHRSRESSDYLFLREDMVRYE